MRPLLAISKQFGERLISYNSVLLACDSMVAVVHWDPPQETNKCVLNHRVGNYWSVGIAFVYHFSISVCLKSRAVLC